MIDLAEARRIVLDIVELPFVRISTYDHKRLGRGYAAVANGTKHRYENWCHDTDATDPPVFYHSTEQAAWVCFAKNHPGVLEAIDILETERRSVDNAEPA